MYFLTLPKFKYQLHVDQLKITCDNLSQGMRNDFLSGYLWANIRIRCYFCWNLGTVQETLPGTTGTTSKNISGTTFAEDQGESQC